MEIIYEDKNILVVNKPHKLVCAPTKAHFNDNLARLVDKHINQPNFIYRMIYRLDKDTAGIMIIAKNLESYHKIKIIDKEYYALCEGNFVQESFIIDKPILTKQHNGINIMKREISNEGKPAKTQVNVIQNLNGYSLIKLKLYTGRTHQIRLHLASISHPLIGDPIYNNASFTDFAFLILKKIRFQFEDKFFEFEIDFPQCWNKKIKAH